MTSRDDQSDGFLNSDAINDDFFIGIVESKLNITRDKFKLRLVMMAPATGKNENYMSVLYRAKIKIQVHETKAMESVDVIIKALLTTIQELKEFSVFPRERFVYENILTSFEKIWLDRAGEEVHFGPKSIKFESEPYEIIVLDDLKAANYVMLDRKNGLNLEQTKTVLAKLAKFHAASAIRYQKDGIIHKDFDRRASMPIFDENNPVTEGLKKITRGFHDKVKNYGDCDMFAAKIDRWDTNRAMTAFIDVATPMRCGFQILNHGDMWLNNMMFKFDEANNPIDVALIDYQLSSWGSPSGDLLYFLITSVADDIKVDHFDDFISYYHNQLSESLKKLRFDQRIPSLTELHVDLLDKGFFSSFCMTNILFVVKYDADEEISMELLMQGGDDEMYDRIYNNEIYKKAVKLWLPFMNKRGFLDCLLPHDIAAVKEKAEE